MRCTYLSGHSPSVATCLTSHHFTHLLHTQGSLCSCRLILLSQTSCWLCPAQLWLKPVTCLIQVQRYSKSGCTVVIRRCNYWRDCCFPDKGCLPVWYYFYPEVCSSRKAMSNRHNRARKQTLPDTTRDLLAKYDTDLTGEQPHRLYSPPHHRHSTVTES